LISSALAAALSDRKQRFFNNSYLYYIGPSLAGEYWLPGFRLAPSLPDDAQPALFNAERVLVLSFHVEAIDREIALAVARERVATLAARLSFIVNVGLYTPPPQHRWVLVHDPETNRLESHRYQLGFSPQAPLINDMPSKGELCPLAPFRGSIRDRYRYAGEHLYLPTETRALLRAMESLSPRISDALDRCARLFHVALVAGAEFPSVAMAYRVAAVEAITQGHPEYTGFSDFIRKNCPDAEPDRLLQDLYGTARSAHFHSGIFPAGEYDRWGFFDPLMSEAWVRRQDLQTTAYELTRSAILNWVFTLIPGAPVPDSSHDDSEPPTP
jgi:hypothetical protein